MPETVKRTRPCDACRRRKTKCVTNDGDTICVLCRFHNQECTYQQTPQPRKRGSSIAGFDGTSGGGRRSKAVRTSAGTGVEVEEYDALPGTTLLRRTLGLQNLHHSRYIGANDVLDVAATSNNGSTNQPSSTKAIKVRFVHPLHAFQIIPDSNAPGHSDEAKLQDDIEQTIKGHGDELVRLYFRIVHPSFPILHKDVFLEKYARSYKEFSPPLLAAVYLLASEYWRFSESLASIPRPDLSELKHLAWRSFRSAAQRPKLSIIQAGLLLSQHKPTERNAMADDVSADVTAQLVDLACRLGLNIDPSDWDIPEWEPGLRRRLAWAVFMQDKWSALLSGRPSRIGTEDWTVGGLDVEDFPETVEDDAAGSSEVQRGRLVFMHMSRLTVILSDVLDQLLSARFQQTLYLTLDKTTALLQRLKPLQIRLKDWFATLPDSLKMDTVASMKLSSVGYLRLAYLTVEMCVHRLLVKTALSSYTPDETLFTVFRSAANERLDNAVDFIQRLQALHLASFWYFTSAQCCALVHHFGRLLEQTAADHEEKTALDRKLREYTWSLKVNGEAGAGFMKQAISMIEASSRVVLSTSGDSSARTSPTMAKSTELIPGMPSWLQAGFTQDVNPGAPVEGDPAYASVDTSEFVSGWEFGMHAQDWEHQIDAMNNGTYVYPP